MIDGLAMVFTISVLLPTLAVATAEDYWPAWRGPLASGVSPRGRPPLTWSETQNVKGKVPVPGPAADPNAPPPFHGGKKCLYGISPG